MAEPYCGAKDKEAKRACYHIAGHLGTHSWEEDIAPSRWEDAEKRSEYGYFLAAAISGLASLSSGDQPVYTLVGVVNAAQAIANTAVELLDKKFPSKKKE